MATISFNLSAEDTARLVDAFGADYQETIGEEPNPETKAQFARHALLKYIKNYVLNYERSHQVVTEIELT